MASDDYQRGRWLTPDPLGLPAQAGGDITNPQSLNRYAYALNNPTTFTDPTGLQCEPWAQCVNVTAEAPSVWLTLFTDFYLGSWPSTPINFPHIGPSGGARPAPPPKPAPSGNTITQRLSCAADFGDAHSLASEFGLGNSAAGQIAFGNTASALTHLAFSIAGSNSSITGTQIANIVLSGTRQGIPGGGPGSQGAEGLGQKAAIGAAVSAGYNAVAGVGSEPIELGITASGKVASVAVPLSEATVGAISTGITVGKFAYDIGAFVFGYTEACNP